MTRKTDPGPHCVQGEGEAAEVNRNDKVHFKKEKILFGYFQTEGKGGREKH